MENGSTIANCPACGQQMHPTDWKDRLREDLTAALARVVELEAAAQAAQADRKDAALMGKALAILREKHSHYTVLSDGNVKMVPCERCELSAAIDAALQAGWKRG